VFRILNRRSQSSQRKFPVLALCGLRALLSNAFTCGTGRRVPVPLQRFSPYAFDLGPAFGGSSTLDPDPEQEIAEFTAEIPSLSPLWSP